MKVLLVLSCALLGLLSPALAEVEADAPTAVELSEEELAQFSIKGLLLQLRERVLTDPAALYAEGMAKYKELSKQGLLDANPIVDNFMQSLSEMEVDDESKAFVLEYIDALLAFADTDSGVRLAATIDKIMLSELSKDGKKPDWLVYLMDVVERKDVISTLLSPVTRLIFVGMDKARTFVKEDPNMFMVNLYLGAQGMGSIDEGNIIMSVVGIAEKMLGLKSGDWVTQTKQFLRQFEKGYYKLADYEKAPRQELHDHMERFLLDALADPVADLFQATLYVRNDTRCAELLLCSFNEKYEKSGAKLKKVVAQGLSFGAAYGWLYLANELNKGDVEKMMKAYIDGYTKGNCRQRHKDAPETCDIFKPVQQVEGDKKKDEL